MQKQVISCDSIVNDAEGHHWQVLTLAFVTVTELFTSSGNNSFSTPADAECIHFKFVR